MTYTYKYPRPAVTADCVVMTREAEPKVLLIQRGGQPFKGDWAFPGGFMDMDETTEHCAIREPATLDSQPLMVRDNSSRSVGGLLYAHKQAVYSSYKHQITLSKMIFYDTKPL